MGISCVSWGDPRGEQAILATHVNITIDLFQIYLQSQKQGPEYRITIFRFCFIIVYYRIK